MMLLLQECVCDVVATGVCDVVVQECVMSW